jgi:type IX secretion system PorP/SprF family membrane protein
VLYAQQDPIYAQYLLNPLVINPAYAGMNNNLSVMGSYRKQWTGLEGQPQTLQANADVSLAQNRVGLGVMLVNDKIGSTANTEFNAVFSYKIMLGDNNALSFGLQGGALQFRNDYSALTPYSTDDPAFTESENVTRLNLGAGIFFKSEHATLSVSVPRMLPSVVKNGTQNFDLYNQHLYLFGTYAWRLTERVDMKPSILMRAVENLPLSFDVCLNFNVNRKYAAGLFARNLNTYGVVLQALILEKYTVGYVFELPAGKTGVAYTTHEISLGLRLAVLGFHVDDGAF